MSNYNRRGLPKLPSEQRQMMSVSTYLDIKSERDNLPGKITAEGKMLVYYQGGWISREELDRVFPKPIVSDFLVHLGNVDTTRLWMHT